jgi:CspA family cold shock protein
VKYVNATKGSGFLQPAVERAARTSLVEGAIVSYEIKSDRGKVSADNLRVG